MQIALLENFRMLLLWPTSSIEDESTLGFGILRITVAVHAITPRGITVVMRWKGCV